MLIWCSSKNADIMIDKQNAVLIIIIKGNADIIVGKENGANVEVKWNADIIEGIGMLA
jgi:hypothetical protein